MKETLNMLHLSSLGIWDLGENKGRMSTYLPLKAFADRGHKVYYLTNDKNQTNVEVGGIKVKRICGAVIKFNKGRLQGIIRRLLAPFSFFCFFIMGFRYSIKNRPNVIYAHTPKTALPAFLLSKIFRSKYVLRLYGVGKFYSSTKFKKMLKIDIHLAFLLKADLYILTNDGTSAEQVATSYGVEKDRIHFLRNGIDKSWANKKSDVLLREELAPNGEKILLSVSRLVKSKQIDLIIKAMPELLKHSKNVKLVIVGDGVEKNNLEVLSINLGLKDFVYFAGSQEQYKIIDYMNIADLFISMNALSSMSNPVFEAMICKKAIVALNTGKTEDIIKNNITGILVDLEQIDKLPEIVNNLLEDDAKREILGKNAQQLIYNEWPSWEERVDYEVDLVEKACTNY